MNSEDKQKHSNIYTHKAPWNIYGMNWSIHKDKKYRLGTKRLVDHYDNRVEMIQLDNEMGDIKDDPNVSFDSFDHMRWHIVTY